MCGIVGILSRPATRPVPSEHEVLAALDAAIDRIDSAGDPAAAAVEARLADRLLMGVPGVLALLDRREFAGEITGRLDRLDAAVADFDRAGDSGEFSSDDVERRAAASIARVT